MLRDFLTQGKGAFGGSGVLGHVRSLGWEFGGYSNRTKALSRKLQAKPKALRARAAEPGYL
ncbi:hypothetical protein MFKK_22240 [Halopseudomonas aestusnigri]|nr:hypothetical protein MFKK_22240 [Halopseudomonas aestusnigri]